MMTTREKIKEGMEQEVFLILMLSENSKQKAKEQAKWLVEKWFRKLHSQGVRIQVDRELPECPLGDDDYYGYACGLADGCRKGQQDMLKAGYGFFEPLIEEEEK